MTQCKTQIGAGTRASRLARLTRACLAWAWIVLGVIAIAGLAPPLAAQDASSLYVVSGVEVDAKEVDAAKAKLKAISEAQVKAFAVLLNRLGGKTAEAKASRFTPSQIGRMMASLSVEEERTGPGRYIGKLTIKFLPKRVRKALNSVGVSFVEEQSPPILVIPVWKQADGTMLLWQDNPWRTAWQQLKAENALVPLLIPLADITDAQTLAVEDIVQGAEQNLEAMRLRYGADAVLVAYGEPVNDNSLRATMQGDSPVGRISFDKTYVATEGGLKGAAAQAVERFHTVLIFKWTKSRTGSSISDSNLQAVNIAVPFSSLQEWNVMRSQLSITASVTNVEVASMSSNGAVVRLTYAQGFEYLQSALRQSRMELVLVGGTWVLRPF